MYVDTQQRDNARVKEKYFKIWLLLFMAVLCVSES